jgi:predicted transcriptional regulator
MKKEDIHIGKIIKEKLTESSMTITEFAKEIHCDRTSVYHIFKQKSIDIEKLIKISEALDYDFIHEIYTKQNNKTPQTIFIAVEIEQDTLQQFNLPSDFIRLIKK